jgi:hypothetical protein
MKFKNSVILGVLLAASMGAAAQWQWLDKDGRKVYSDRPPPPETPEKNILKQPGRPASAQAAAQPAAKAASSPASAPAAGSTPRLSGKDKELEEKKKQAEQAEAAQKKAEEEKYQKARAENCNRAKLAKSSFDTGARIARTNEKGEREILDEAGRAAEGQRIQDVIKSECSPAGTR